MLDPKGVRTGPGCDAHVTAVSPPPLPPMKKHAPKIPARAALTLHASLQSLTRLFDDGRRQPHLFLQCRSLASASEKTLGVSKTLRQFLLNMVRRQATHMGPY